MFFSGCLIKVSTLFSKLMLLESFTTTVKLIRDDFVSFVTLKRSESSFILSYSSHFVMSSDFNFSSRLKNEYSSPLINFSSANIVFFWNVNCEIFSSSKFASFWQIRSRGIFFIFHLFIYLFFDRTVFFSLMSKYFFDRQVFLDLQSVP